MATIRIQQKTADQTMYHNPDMLSDRRSGILLFIGESFGHALVLVLGLILLNEMARSGEIGK